MERKDWDMLALAREINEWCARHGFHAWGVHARVQAAFETEGNDLMARREVWEKVRDRLAHLVHPDEYERYGFTKPVWIAWQAWDAVKALAPGNADRDQKERGLLHALLMNAAASLRIGSQMAVLPGLHDGDVLLVLQETDEALTICLVK